MPQPPIPFIATTDSDQEAAWVAELQAALPEERIVALRELSADERKATTIAVVANPAPTDLHALPQLRWVHSVWAGVERLVAELGDSPLEIVRLIDPQLAGTMAEAVLAWTLFLHREMPAYARAQQRSLWQARPYVRPEHRTVGLLGLGELGTASALRLLANGFRVCGWSRAPKALPGIACFSGDSGLETLLEQTDIVVCLLPLTPDTRGLLDARRLARLPQGASLINFARGPIVVDQDLRTALDRGQLEHAVLDVFAAEPLANDQWPWRHPRVTVLPHCSAPTDRQSAARIVAKNVRHYRACGELPGCVDRARGY